MRILLFVLIILASCQNNDGRKSSSKADTTRVVELAIRTALGRDFPEMDDIKRHSSQDDSIFFTTTLFPLSKLPTSVDSFRFRVLPDSIICRVIKRDTTIEIIPNYLRLQTFQKTDTGYFVELESVVCIPTATRDASVGIHILKTRDKYEFTDDK